MEGPALFNELGPDLAEPAESFDLVLSRMALHYVPDLGRVLRACRACLAPGGRVVFTVVHPVITSHDARESSAEPRQNWVVDDTSLRARAISDGSAPERSGNTGPSRTT